MIEEEKITEFILENRDKIENPIIQGFLSNEYNLSLLKKYILVPSDVNKNNVDEAFKFHYNRVLKIKYVSNLIHFFSMDYDKKRRKDNEKVLLILDKTSRNDDRTLIKDLIQDNNQVQHSYESNLLENIESVTLVGALKKLTDRQLKILDMIYHKQLPIKEISEILNTTPQNISNLHRKALKKLSHLLKEEVHSKDEQT